MEQRNDNVTIDGRSKIYGITLYKIELFTQLRRQVVAALMAECDHLCTAIDASHAEAASNEFDSMTGTAASKFEY
jgi:hypothetical protein